MLGRFFSWRWRITLPLLALLLPAALVAAYLLGQLITRRASAEQDRTLVALADGLFTRSERLYAAHAQATQRIAFTLGVPQAVAARQTTALQDTIQAEALANDFSAVLLTDSAGDEVLGVLRASNTSDDNTRSIGSSLDSLPIVPSVLAGDTAVGWAETPDGLMLFLGVPLALDGQPVGGVITGYNAEQVTAALAEPSAALTLYAPSGVIVSGDPVPLDGTLQASISQTTGVELRSLTLNGNMARVAYLPLRYGGGNLGVVALTQADAAAQNGRAVPALVILVTGGLSASAVILALLGTTLLTERLDRIRRTAQALERGHREARTRFAPTDEAGSVGAALDAYANRVQQQQTELETRLRKQREETYQLFGVLESLQSAVIVQDGSGQITLMNAPARALCNGLAPAQLRATLQSSPATLQGRRYTLAVSALKSTGGHSGRVITLTAVDGTPAAAPIIKEAPAVTLTQALQVRGVALAELIEGMRDLSAPDDHSPALTPKPILLETLLWAAANEWRQVAQAAGLSLHVQLNVRGLVILADERRLRWALGNLLDNAVKYTLQGGVVILEVKEQAAKHVIVRVRDSGVGISAPDLAQIGAGYFRGTPTTPDGHVIRVAGAGQGILAARQIIAAHNGTLELRSTVGVGTAVYIRLPLTDARALDLPLLPGDDEGETVQLPEG